MNKNLKLIKDPDCKHHVEVTLTPLGDKIKYRITGNVFCERMQELLPNSRTFHRDDLVWNAVFGSVLNTKKFLSRNRIIRKVISINLLGYSACDHIQN